MYCNRIFENRLLRIVLSILFAVIFVVVPIEHRMLTAHAAIQAAVLIPVICAILVAMGITFGGAFLNNEDLQNANANWADNVCQSLTSLAQDIYDNCDGIIEALALSFPGGSAVIGAKRIIQIAPLAYQLIKKYLAEKYGMAREIEDIINGGSYFNAGIISVGGQFITPISEFDSENISTYLGTSTFAFTLVENSSYCTSYGIPCNVSGYFNFKTVSSKGVYTYNNAIKYSGSVSSSVKYPFNSYTYDPGSCAFCLFYGTIYEPDDYSPYGSVDLYVTSRYDNTNGGTTACTGYIKSSGNFGRIQFNSDDEFLAAAGETDVAAFDIVDVDSKIYDNTSSANYPKYVYLYEKAVDYVGQTATDVAAPAYSDVYDSNVVDNASRTVIWQGDRTLCPIDALQGSIPADVIGTWNATWDATSTLCNITCYAEDGTVAWTGSVATTLTWAEVLELLSDITITGPIGAAAAVGSLALPDVSLNFDPLKVAGSTFSKKFPFCLPFDLYRAFLQFNTEETAKAPVYELPFNFGEQFGTHYIIIDMNKWSSVAAIVKWCTYISFMVSLIVITKKIMGGS